MEMWTLRIALAMSVAIATYQYSHRNMTINFYDCEGQKLGQAEIRR